jgi:hypothetical protein
MRNWTKSDSWISRVEESMSWKLHKKLDVSQLSYTAAYAAVYDILQFCKVCTIWCPGNWQRSRSAHIWLSMSVTWHVSSEEEFLIDIIMGYETWCHCYEPKNTSQSLQWKHKFTHVCKKIRWWPSVTKLMLMVFWGFQLPFLWTLATSAV